MNPLWRFLNPLDKAGGLVGRLVAPVAMLIAASLTVPGSPLQVAGLIGGLDVSVYSGEIDQARWESAGTEVAVVGASQYAESTLYNARSAGKVTAAYCYINPQRDVIGQVDNCKASYGTEWPYLNFMAADFEAQGMTVNQILVSLQRIRDLGGRPAFYSGCWAIEAFLQGQDLRPLAGVAYWNAAYTKSGNFEGIQYRNCIPGALLIGEQYAGSDTRWGIWSDANVFDDAFIREGYPYTVSLPASDPPAVTAWQPTLIRIGGTSDVYLVVGGLKISFCNADVFGAQGFAWEQVREVTAADPLWQLPGIGCR